LSDFNKPGHYRLVVSVFIILDAKENKRECLMCIGVVSNAQV